MTDFVMSKTGTLTTANLRATWLYFHKEDAEDSNKREAHKLIDE